jgi:hypothetical protein
MAPDSAVLMTSIEIVVAETRSGMTWIGQGLPRRRLILSIGPRVALSASIADVRGGARSHGATDEKCRRG